MLIPDSHNAFRILAFTLIQTATMKRLELFEFEDYAWLPDFIRTGTTNLIIVLHNLLGTSEVISRLIKNARSKTEFNQIVDMGSGSGGAMMEVAKFFNTTKDNNELSILLSDLHPNSEIVDRINSLQLDNLSYHKTSVDATNFSNTPKGLKTMINSFHHMSPPMATKILTEAQNNNEPILIYEMGENFVPTLLWWLLLPLSLVILFVMALVFTPFTRPITFRQLLFTYLIPIIPLVYAWDGQASTMRTYTFEDLRSILPESDSYKWEMDVAKKENGKKVGYYLLGYPMG